MSAAGTKPVTVVHKDFWQTVQDDFYAAEHWVVTEAEDGLAAATNIFRNVWSVVAPQQLMILGRVALFVEGRMAAGDDFGKAMVAGLNELAAEEKTALTGLESSLLNSIVQLHLAKPTAGTTA